MRQGFLFQFMLCNPYREKRCFIIYCYIPFEASAAFIMSPLRSDEKADTDLVSEFWLRCQSLCKTIDYLELDMAAEGLTCVSLYLNLWNHTVRKLPCDAFTYVLALVVQSFSWVKNRPFIDASIWGICYTFALTSSRPLCCACWQC